MQTYNKLIRDKVVDHILAKGEEVFFHRATPEEYQEKLYEKLQEEVTEFLEAENQEEMADVFEVITAILKHKNWNIEDIIEIQKQKREDKGGFDKALILEKS